MRYVIFTRVSDIKQTTLNQTWECKKHLSAIQKQEDEVIEFNEPETSTRLKPAKRPILMAMLKFVQKGDTLVVYKMNRLARDSEEMVVIYNDLLRKGVIVYSIQEPKLDKSIIHVFAMVAEMERESIRTTTISGLKRKQANMEKVGTAWYGYSTDKTKLQERPQVRSTGKPYLLVPKTSEQEQIEIMINMHQSGCSYGEIVQTLAEKGYKNRAGNPVQKMTVYRILKRLGKLRLTPKAILASLSHESTQSFSELSDKLLSNAQG